ncbi:MAG: hypothetical protein ACJAYU_002692 [Bradymonadia bacterium]
MKANRSSLTGITPTAHNSMLDQSVRYFDPDSFVPEDHYYPRVLNAHVHPLVRYFRSLGNAQLAARYCHLHPEADKAAVTSLLSHRTKHFRWAGADLLHATTDQGVRRIIVIETNSSPSGQKSTPFADGDEFGGYARLLKTSFLPMLKRRGLPAGGLAVICDKNPMETTGYAATLAELTGERVWWVPFQRDDADPPARFANGVLHIRKPDGEWLPIRAAFRYVTQRPWERIPAISKTLIYNPVIACLAGGRNKLMAAKAYDLLNASHAEKGLRVRTPETIWDVAKSEVPLWVERMGGVAVVKVPYANAGQGVYTITNSGELDAFMKAEHEYGLFIVQGLVGNASWSSRTRGERLYHVGTVPDRQGRIFAADLRFMVGVGPEGFFPIATYARRARVPLSEKLASDADSWGMLGTNLSVKTESGWTTEPERLMLMDSRDFNRLGIGLDDLTEAYIQTVLAVTAIDDLAQRLITSKGTFRRRFFGTLNPDDKLTGEIYQ